MFAGCCGRGQEEQESVVKVVNPLQQNLGDIDGPDNFVNMSMDVQAEAEDIDDLIDACADGDHIQLQALLKRGAHNPPHRSPPMYTCSCRSWPRLAHTQRRARENCFSAPQVSPPTRWIPTPGAPRS
jgi:hypothetical protein